ncbi:MAG: hypothetical protein RLZZ401_1914 [Pseudomonadota bacterium]|jgi:putative two-component system response regulator
MVQKTVLIVDDYPENLTLLGEALESCYAVRVANSGARALELAQLQPQPDLILLDIMMPEMDGHEVLRRLRKNAATAAIPVIFVTATHSAEDEENGLKLGAVDYVTKPFRPAIVLARVAIHLELKENRDLLRARNVSLEEEVTRRMEENQDIQDASIHALARLAETRDNETGNHLLRTQEYVRLLATRLQTHPRFRSVFNDKTIALLVKSAPLHDIGKVGIPDRILLKPGKLDPAEWTIMKTHAELGARAIEAAEKDMARPIAFLAFAKDIAHFHHERWDGSGYPDGLAGDKIPAAARLMALADVFDALISRRVYKPAFGLQAVHEMIVAERGLHFDPDVVDAFVEDLDEFCAVAHRYADAGNPLTSA